MLGIFPYRCKSAPGLPVLLSCRIPGRVAGDAGEVTGWPAGPGGRFARRPSFACGPGGPGGPGHPTSTVTVRVGAGAPWDRAVDTR